MPMVNVRHVRKDHGQMVKETPVQNANQKKKYIMMDHVKAVLMVLFPMKIEDFVYVAPKV